MRAAGLLIKQLNLDIVFMFRWMLNAAMFRCSSVLNSSSNCHELIPFQKARFSEIANFENLKLTPCRHKGTLAPWQPTLPIIWMGAESADAFCGLISC